MISTPSQPIGLFDSGIGGLTIFRELTRLLPFEEFLYFGDTARLPYGNKSPESIARYSLECASFLCSQGIKLLIVACHTASTQALSLLQTTLSIPVLGVSQSGFAMILEAPQERIAILGTSSTIASNAYQQFVQLHAPERQLFPIACPLFVPLVEENLFDHEAAQLIVHHYLDPLKDSRINAALLACTHYPLLKCRIQSALGPSVHLLDPAFHSAKEARQLLIKQQLLTPHTTTPQHRFFVTDNPSRFATLAHLFLGEILDPAQISLSKISS